MASRAGLPLDLLEAERSRARFRQSRSGGGALAACRRIPRGVDHHFDPILCRQARLHGVQLRVVPHRPYLRERGITSLTHGSPPELRHFDSREQQSAFLVAYLKQVGTEESALRGVCVVARTRQERDAIAALMKEHDLAHVVLEAGAVDSAETEGVRLATMHRVKGLEFDRVVMASMNADLVPLPAALDGRGDAVERESAETEERALVYVAATRAKKELLVLSFDTPSRLL